MCLQPTTTRVERALASVSLFLENLPAAPARRSLRLFGVFGYDFAAVLRATVMQPAEIFGWKFCRATVPRDLPKTNPGRDPSHWSPYQETGYALLSVVCTDLEHHDFPHVFASTDPLVPLVISVGRYWPATGEIRLADLWVPTGHALYIPPKPLLLGAPCMDLHNNRNSARACWGNIHKSGIATHTLLQTSGTYTYWYWNPLDTDHSPLR